MRATKKTAVLAAVAGALLALNLVDSGTGSRLAEQLPLIEALPRDEVTRIEISTAVNTVVMESAAIEDALGVGEDKRVWRLVAPIEGEADQVAVRTLLNNFRKDVTLDVKVDEGNLVDYGLDANNGLVVEIFRGGDEPDLSFTVGFDGPGGTSFIRLSGDDAVYRARVGGRHRYDKKGAEWRNRVLMGFQSKEAVALGVQQEGVETLRLVRGPSPGAGPDGEALPGTWSLDPDPGFLPDQMAAANLMASLGNMRAGEILGPDFEGGFSPPAAMLEVTLDDDSTRVLEVGTASTPDSAIVRVGGKPDVYRAPVPAIAASRLPAAEFRDRQLFSFQRTDVDTYAWEEAGQTRVLLQQDLATNLWNVIQPANTDIDIKLVFFSLNTVADLRADDIGRGVEPARAGLVTPRARVIARMLDGTLRILELGAETRDSRNRPVRFVRVAGEDTIYMVRLPVLERVRKGFGLN
jgi:hypothetical protein